MAPDWGTDPQPIGRLPPVPPVPSHSEAKHNPEISGRKQEDEEEREWEREKKTIAIIIKPRTIQPRLLTKGKWSQSGLHARLHPITVWLGFTARLEFFCIVLLHHEEPSSKISVQPSTTGNQHKLEGDHVENESVIRKSFFLLQTHEVRNALKAQVDLFFKYCNLVPNADKDKQVNIKQVRDGATSCSAGNDLTTSLYLTVILTFFSPPLPSMRSPQQRYNVSYTFHLNYNNDTQFDH